MKIAQRQSIKCNWLGQLKQKIGKVVKGNKVPQWNISELMRLTDNRFVRWQALKGVLREAESLWLKDVKLQRMPGFHCLQNLISLKKNSENEFPGFLCPFLWFEHRFVVSSVCLAGSGKSCVDSECISSFWFFESNWNKTWYKATCCFDTRRIVQKWERRANKASIKP